MKKLIRLFRNGYLADKNFYDCKKMTVEDYFTKKRFNFPPEMYKENVSIFEKVLGYKEVN